MERSVPAHEYCMYAESIAVNRQETNIQTTLYENKTQNQLANSQVLEISEHHHIYSEVKHWD